MDDLVQKLKDGLLVTTWAAVGITVGGSVLIIIARIWWLIIESIF